MNKIIFFLIFNLFIYLESTPISSNITKSKNVKIFVNVTTTKTITAKKDLIYSNETIKKLQIYGYKQGLLDLDPSIDMSNFNPLNLNSNQTGILQTMNQGTCWRTSYGRGAGVPVSYCDPEKYDKDGALCYPKCEEGYVGNGPICWEQCKEGFTDRGVFCIIDLYVYNKGCCCLPGIDDECCNNCPANYTDDGCTCRRPPKSYPKKSYNRGSGESLSCTPEEELNGLLCYPICTGEYKGNGPVCWKKCKSPFAGECGALCVVNQLNCFSKVVALVFTHVPPAGSLLAFQSLDFLVNLIYVKNIPFQFYGPNCYD